ncbi:LysR family transcriptional regulator [Aureimonas ureilytica]|uniref:LysR family transcriptional regulator n=1 Tax=Aureimonas ureilytica TaxID=401562 RepID=UPI0003640A09|nr:LysR family transcriptional regulator [Aureimonas ureilytica]
MSLRAFRTLVAIANHGSFARAGEVVGLTQSAVSLQVKALEEEFGTKLFDRSRRRPVLTEAGQIVLARAEEVLALYDGIARELDAEHGLTGRLKLGAIQTALSGSLPDALITMSRAHPRVRVHVAAGMSAELAVAVAAGDLDAAVTTEPVRPYPPGLIWSTLYEDNFWLVAPPGCSAATVRDVLGDRPFIRFDSRAWAGRTIDRELRRLRLVVREEMVLDSQEVILRMVAKGLGVAVLPLRHRPADLACLPFGEPQLCRRVVLLERQDRKGGALAAAFGRAMAASDAAVQAT